MSKTTRHHVKCQETSVRTSGWIGRRRTAAHGEGGRVVEEFTSLMYVE
jgi:hypothetical protein